MYSVLPYMYSVHCTALQLKCTVYCLTGIISNSNFYRFIQAVGMLFYIDEHIQSQNRMNHIKESSIVLYLTLLDGIKQKSNKSLWRVRSQYVYCLSHITKGK